jgi:hypothetical protein
MSLYGYTFIKEIEKFNIDSYVPHLGWLKPRIMTLKIYSRSGSLSFYLHDEITDRLFEFSADDPKKLKSSEEYEKVVRVYLVTYPN